MSEARERLANVLVSAAALAAQKNPSGFLSWLDGWLERLLGEDDTSGAVVPQPLQVVQASLSDEQSAKAIIFEYPVTSSQGKTTTITWQLDSGAFNDLLALTLADAQALGFAPTGTVDVSGVGGSVKLEETDISVSLGGHTYTIKNAVIDPQLNVSLWGATLEIDDDIAIAWNPKTAKVGFFPADGFVV